MPIQSTDTTSQIAFDSDFESWLITSTAHVVTSGQGQANAGVLMSHTEDHLTNLGAIVSVATAVELDGSGGGFASTVTNGPGGYISSSNSGVDSTQDQTTVINDGVIDGFAGVTFEANLETLVNSGQIHTYQTAVFSNGHSVSVQNSGEITSATYAINFNTGPGSFQITNSGAISGGYAAIECIGGMVLHNTGSILGYVDLHHADASEVTNRGLIDGNVDFGAAADTYDGRGGTVTGGVSGGAGADTLIGGVGDDTLIGGTGRDRLDGGKGPGADTFVYSTIDDSTSTSMDVIAKHFNASDVFDVSALDAVKHAGGHQAFTFGGQVAPGDTLATGVIDYFQQGGDTYIVADTSGDGHADFEVQIHGTFTLTAGEFVL